MTQQVEIIGADSQILIPFGTNPYLNQSDAFARICPIERVNTLVTDGGAPDETVAAFESAGITVVRV